jgi:hypothetical protein
MIGQYLPQANKSAIIAKSKKFSHVNKVSRPDRENRDTRNIISARPSPRVRAATATIKSGQNMSFC